MNASHEREDKWGSQVEHQILDVEVRGLKSALDTWWWGRISPYQPYPKGAASVATTLLAEW